MSTRDQFLAAILEDPDDDGARLIFADYLEENGEAEHARFIRAQIELANLPEYDPLWIRTRFNDYHFLHGQHLEQSWPTLPEGVSWQPPACRRGFPSSIRVARAEDFVAHAPALFRLAPIEALTIRWQFAAPLDLTELCASPHLARIRTLCFQQSGLPPVAIELLQDSPHAGNLDDLRFELEGINVAALPVLLQGPLMRRLRSLHLCDLPVAASMLGAALREVDPGRLRRLVIRNLTVFEMLTPFFDGPLCRQLVELHLRSVLVGAAGMEALCTADLAPSLQSLVLESVEPGETGVRTLAECARFGALRRLDLSYNRLGPREVTALAQGPLLANLRVLALNDNPLSDAGAEALADCPSLSHLAQLELKNCAIGDAGAEALLFSTMARNLTQLHLTGANMRISEAMKARFRRRSMPVDF